MRKHLLLGIITMLLILISGASFAAEPQLVRVGAFSYYPGIFMDKDGAVKGFYVDALADIARRENIRFEYVYGSWSEGLERIKTGEVDVLTSVAFTPERAEFLDYAKTPLLTVWSELYVPLASEIDGIRAVQGKKIAVMKGDFNARHFIELVKKFDITCEFVEMPGFDDVFRAVKAKEVDAGVVNSAFGAARQKDFGLRSTGVVFNPFDIFFAVAKGENKKLLVMLDNYLIKWRHQQDSPFNMARQKWSHGSSDAIRIIPRWLFASVALLAVLALCAFAFIVVLRRQVRSKTRSVIKAAEQYRIVSERQNAILAAVPDIIMEVDTNKVYTWSNNAGLEFFGENVIGREAAYYFEGDQNTYDIVQPLFEGEKKALYVESLQRRKDGEVRLLAWWCKTFVDEHGSVTGTLSTARDITDRKRTETEKTKLEDQLRQSQKMESVGRLAGGVAHDFNNMLTIILGRSELALMKMDPSQPLYAGLTEIHFAAERSADLTRQLLAFARRQAIAPRVLDLNETVAGMLKMLQRLIGEDAQLTWRPKSNLWPVRMDPSQIDQVLANLCVNAHDAIADIGRITIETGNRAVDEHYCAVHAGFVPGDYVLLTVSDDGCGMDKETLAHIYEPFFTTKGIGKGTGLGLATVYGIVKQNNGFINVYSEPQRGTTFTIYLPRYKGEAGRVKTENAAKLSPRGHETILLVEDEPSILGMTTVMLEGLGYTVLPANTPGAAIGLAGKHNGEIRLLMTDVVMPEMNGLSLAQKLLPLYPDLKRLFMSGYTADVIAHHGVLDEGVHFIQKPFSVADVATKVREVLEG